MQNKQNHTSRAKLFLPFDSLKGFRDYLKCKERVVVDKKQLSSDACEVLIVNYSRFKRVKWLKLFIMISRNM